MEHYDLLVIGGVAAGTKAAAKTRRERRDWRIGIVTEDTDISYAGCGLPYYLGGVINTRKQLVVKTPEGLAEFSGLEIFTGHRAVAIDREAHTVTVVGPEQGNERKLSYGRLLLATGARPVVPPIPGGDLEGVHVLRTVRDADRVLEALDAREKGRCTIIGGGFIGVEVAENMLARGWDATIIEMLPQILPPFDREVALYVQAHLEKKGVRVMTNSTVQSLERTGDGLRVRTSSGDVMCDLVLMSVGVRPNSELAGEAGLELGQRGAVRVDCHGRTSDPDIFAAGDCATTTGIVTGKEVWAPMGSTANKQARLAAMTLSGDETDMSCFPGVLGTMVVKAFDVSAARTGLGEQEARELGHDIITVLVPADDRAHYYPGSAKICLKLVADRSTGRLLGAQAYGYGVVDKPIDVLATAISLKATARDLANLDLAYAPPFSTAINPVNLACHVLLNKMTGRMDGIGPEQLHETLSSGGWGGLLLDIRTEPEFTVGTLPGAVNIPLGELGSRLGEIEGYREKPVVVICNYGKNAYEGYLRLRHLGFIRVKVLEGGTRFWPYEMV